MRCPHCSEAIGGLQETCPRCRQPLLTPTEHDVRWLVAHELDLRRNYNLEALLTFCLYLAFWPAGLFTNVYFFQRARELKARVGYPPQGMGCLLAMLTVCGMVPLALMALYFTYALMSRGL